MHAVRSVTCLHEGARRVARYANDRICPAECPIDPAAHPVAVVDVRVDEGLGPREGRKDHARYGIAWPVSGMQDLDPVVPDVCGEPQHACCCGRQAAGEAGKLLKFGSLPQRWPKVRRTQRNTGNRTQFVERWCWRSLLPRRMEFEYVLREVAQK